MQSHSFGAHTRLPCPLWRRRKSPIRRPLPQASPLRLRQPGAPRLVRDPEHRIRNRGERQGLPHRPARLIYSQNAPGRSAKNGRTHRDEESRQRRKPWSRRFFRPRRRTKEPLSRSPGPHRNGRRLLPKDRQLRRRLCSRGLSGTSRRPAASGMDQSILY